MEKKTLNIKVDINFDKNRIDKFLHSNLSQFSRSTLKRLINDGCVKLNNKIIYEASKKVKSKDNIDGLTTVHIKDKPLNEYTNNPELLHLAFPLLFPLGITTRNVRSTGLMKKSTIRRLLCSADGRFARAKPFLFLLMNQKMRHDNNRTVALRINANTEMSTKFVEMFMKLLQFPRYVQEIRRQF